MMRVRENGTVVPRHNVGMLRTVRGVLNVSDQNFPELRRHARVARFTTEQGDVITLVDVALMHATRETLVLSGFERGLNGGKSVDYAQTWVLVDCEGDKPEGSRGPAFVR